MDQINQRISKCIEHLGIKKAEFAKRLNVSQAFISQLCSGKSKPSDRTISDICREFNISETWLKTGIGNVFVEQAAFNLEEFAKQRGATEFEVQIVKRYFELPPNIRQTLVEHFKHGILEKSAAPSDEQTESALPNDETEESDLEFDPEIEAELKTIRNRLYREKGQREILQTLKSGGSATRNWSGSLRADNA